MRVSRGAAPITLSFVQRLDDPPLVGQAETATELTKGVVCGSPVAKSSWNCIKRAGDARLSPLLATTAQEPQLMPSTDVRVCTARELLTDKVLLRFMVWHCWPRPAFKAELV